MYCDCGHPMHWRCTNNVTNIVKYKCPMCGMVKTEKVDPPKPIKVKVKKRKKPPIPKNYHRSMGKWEVKKYIDGEQVYFCRTKTEEEAKKVVEKLRECNWDKTQMDRIKKEVLG